MTARIRTGAPACALWLAVLGGAGLGCATQGQRGAGDAAEVGAALARLRPAPAGEGPINGTGHPMAYLVYRGEAGPTIGAYDLGKSALLWKQPGEATGRIEVGRAAIVHAAKAPGGGAMLVGRAGGGGEVLWREEIAGAQRLIGYCIDGDTAYYVVRAFTDTGTHGVATLVAIDARTGAARWRHELPPGDAGGPAARGGLVAVPVATQYVIVHDGDTGAELARILSTEEAASFIRVQPEGFYFGSKGIFRASAETARASRRSPGYAAAVLPRFARGVYGRDMYRPEQEDYSAIDCNRVQWRAAADADGRRMSFRNGLVFVHDFRFFFAIDAATGALRWVHAEKTSDAVVAQHAGPTLIFATADGEIGALDAATGQPRFRARVPGASLVRGATFDADGFAGSAGAEAGEGTALPAALAGIVWDTDRRFPDELAAYAVEELGKLPGRAVTADLLKVVQTPTLAAAARKKAEQALAARRDDDSADLLVEALGQRADYVEDTHPTAVVAIARATMATRSRPVAVALSEHLRRPETVPEAIIEISQAVRAAGAADALPALRDFVCMYRGDPFYDADPAALIAVADTVLALGGAAERQLLLFVAEESRTVEPLRRHLQRALAQPPLVASPAAAGGGASPAAAPSSP